MNYSKHYELLIEKARNRKLDGYFEIHHVIPKAFGGSNKKDNLVKLMPREHYIAHLFLWKMQIDKRKRNQMLKACVMMKGKREFGFNSRMYENVRSEFSKMQSERMLCNHPHKGLSMTDNQRKQISISKKNLYSNKENHPMYGRKHTVESIIKNKKANSLEINIYDANNNLIFVCDTGFEEFCNENNLPFKSLKKSYQTNGEYKLYESFNGSRSSPPRNEDFIKYTAWYAVKIK